MQVFVACSYRLAANFSPSCADTVSLMGSIDGIETGAEISFSKNLARHGRSYTLCIGTCEELLLSCCKRIAFEEPAH
jgi:hypothetical protein